VLAAITEREPVQRILSHLGMPTGPPPVARARDPSDDDDPAQLELALGLMDAKGGEPALEDEPGGRGAPLERVKSIGSFSGNGKSPRPLIGGD
jgi:hypothetical protein